MTAKLNSRSGEYHDNRRGCDFALEIAVHEVDGDANRSKPYDTVPTNYESRCSLRYYDHYDLSLGESETAGSDNPFLSSCCTRLSLKNL